MAIKIEELKCCVDVILRMEHKLNVVKERQKIEPIEIESLQYDVDLLRKWAGIEHLHDRKAKLDIPLVSNSLLDLDGKTIPVTFHVSKYKPKIDIDLSNVC
jgi:hypothetical protein